MVFIVILVLTILVGYLVTPGRLYPYRRIFPVHTLLHDIRHLHCELFLAQGPAETTVSASRFRWCTVAFILPFWFTHVNLILILKLIFCSLASMYSCVLNANECRKLCALESPFVVRLQSLEPLFALSYVYLYYLWQCRNGAQASGVAQEGTKGRASFTPVQNLEETWCTTFPGISKICFNLLRTVLAPFSCLALDGTMKNGDRSLSTRRRTRTW
ncbi:hypothetical protein V8E53_008511 [Lactarius tabidus]